MKLRKLFNYQTLIIAASILPIALFGLLTYYSAKADKTKAIFARVSTINEQKKEIALEYFKGVEFDARNLSQNMLFLQIQTTKNITNLQELQKKHIQAHYDNFKTNIAILAQKDIFQYIFSFINKGKTVNLEYLRELAKYEEILRARNVLMINESGKIVYSSKEKERIGQYAEDVTPSFKKIWRQIKSSKREYENSVLFVQPGYDAITNSYKQFAITHFKDVEGFVAMELDVQNIQNDIANVNSLGRTAETYMVYKEGDETFLATDRSVKKGRVGDKAQGEYIDLGFASSGSAIKIGSAGNIEIDCYTPVKIFNMTFSLQTTISYAETISPIKGANYFERFLADYGYLNVSLISKDGKMFYSVEKGDDFKTNILTGKYSQTFLAKAVKDVFKSKTFLLTDIGLYEASPEKIAQFAIMPILDENSEVQTIIVLQTRLSDLSEKMATGGGIYSTNETYLVGRDYGLRSDTSLKTDKYGLLNSYAEGLKINTAPVRLAFATDKNTTTAKDYRGKDVLASFSELKYSLIDWAVITEIDDDEIAEELNALKLNIYAFVIVASLIVFFVLVLITNEKKKNYKKLEHQAMHDSLTELPNRKYALEFLSYILANNKRDKRNGAVLFIDLDKFKIINDTYGHKAGDCVLQRVAARIKEILREGDLLARLGGDEFIVIMDKFAAQSDIDALCKKIINSLSEPINDDERKYEVGLSIGVSTFPNDSDDATELLMFADTAMFKTKDDGRNGYTFYDKEMTRKSLKAARVEADLKRAIANDELTLHYQPQVDLRTNAVIGTEALVRWNHPADGLIMPNDFIPIAENSNLIVDLGYWVLERACSDFQKWRALGYEMGYVAVNMSSKQLQSHDCVESVMEILNKLSFNPECVELEITETTLISNFESAIKNIEAFKKIGIKFSIDDFGTGYSSLSYLKSLRISTLKIDREFIKDIIADRDSRTIVTAIIAMGHALEYAIVAEGAETRAEIELLKYLACDVAQGYYFSKPLSEEKLLEFIDAKR